MTEDAELFLCSTLKLTSAAEEDLWGDNLAGLQLTARLGVNVMCDGDYCWTGQWTAPS